MHFNNTKVTQLHFHGNNGYVDVPQYYIIHTSATIVHLKFFTLNYYVQISVCYKLCFYQAYRQHEIVLLKKHSMAQSCKMT